MMMNFVCVYENGRTVEGTNEIKKQPLGKLSGVWEGGVGKESNFNSYPNLLLKPQ